MFTPTTIEIQFNRHKLIKSFHIFFFFFKSVIVCAHAVARSQNEEKRRRRKLNRKLNGIQTIFFPRYHKQTYIFYFFFFAFACYVVCSRQADDPISVKKKKLGGFKWAQKLFFFFEVMICVRAIASIQIQLNVMHFTRIFITDLNQ